MKTIKTIAAAGLLLGTTSVMAATGSDAGTGDFKFTLEENFTVSCDDTDGSTDEVDKMVVAAPSDLKNATATISCEVTTNATAWSILLDATNGGKMKHGSDIIQVDSDDGVLGMWVELTDVTNANVSIETDKVATPLLLVDEGEVQSNGGYITSGFANINLANVLDVGSTNFVADENVGTVTFEIRAALIGTAITSTADGEDYTETITITAASAI